MEELAKNEREMGRTLSRTERWGREGMRRRITQSTIMKKNKENN